MGQCRYCGRSGVFLLLSANYLCKNCNPIFVKDLVERSRVIQDSIEAVSRAKKSKFKISAYDQVIANAEALLEYEKRGIPTIDPLPSSLVEEFRSIKEAVSREESCKPYSSRNVKQNLFDDYVVIDVETTGYDPRESEIIELAAARFKDGNILDSFQSLVQPKTPVPKKITKVTGITNDMLRSAPPIEAALPAFMRFVSRTPLVAHNASFDIGFIQRYASMQGLRIESQVVDTLWMCKECFPDLANHRMETVALHLQVDVDDLHRALPDCIATSAIYQRCVEIFRERLAKPKKKRAEEVPYDPNEVIPNDPVDRNLRGIELEKLGKVDNAIELYELNVRDNDDGTHPYERLAIIYRRRKRVEDEISVLERGVWVFEHIVHEGRVDRLDKLHVLRKRLAKARALCH